MQVPATGSFEAHRAGTDGFEQGRSHAIQRIGEWETRYWFSSIQTRRGSAPQATEDYCHQGADVTQSSRKTARLAEARRWRPDQERRSRQRRHRSQQRSRRNSQDRYYPHYKVDRTEALCAGIDQL